MIAIIITIKSMYHLALVENLAVLQECHHMVPLIRFHDRYRDLIPILAVLPIPTTLPHLLHLTTLITTIPLTKPHLLHIRIPTPPR